MNKKRIIILSLISTFSIVYLTLFCIFHKKSAVFNVVVNNKFVYPLTIEEYTKIMKGATSKSLRRKLKASFMGIKYTEIFLNEKEDYEFRCLYADYVN